MDVGRGGGSENVNGVGLTLWQIFVSVVLNFRVPDTYTVKQFIIESVT